LTSPPFPKRILVDANFLVAWFDRGTSTADRARIEYFVDQAEKAKSRIIVPTPAIAEYLVKADVAGIEMVNKLDRKTYVLIAPFDMTSAFECSQLDRAAIGAGDKRDGVTEPWQKIKIDRQIVAIGKANGASLVVSDDDGVRNNALRVGMRASSIAQLELPKSALQAPLSFPERKSKKKPSS